jgi:hypothetical protein
VACASGSGSFCSRRGQDAELTVREVLALYAASYPRSLPVTDVIALVGPRWLILRLRTYTCS